MRITKILSDCADAQADLRLGCVHISEGWFSHGAAHVIAWIPPLREAMLSECFAFLILKKILLKKIPFTEGKRIKDRNSCPKVVWLVQMAANLYLIALICELLQVRNDINDIKMWCASIINLIIDN